MKEEKRGKMTRKNERRKKRQKFEGKMEVLKAAKYQFWNFI